MIEIAKGSVKDRHDLFRNASSILGLTDAIVEKDFWVCFVLNILFGKSPFKNRILFKGGTSLSKAYGLIERFSEDIDLILDWRLLGYEKDEPWAVRSKSKQDAFNREANERAEFFLKDAFTPSLKETISGILGFDADMEIDKYDPQTVIFSYPRIFSSSSAVNAIRLEIGPLAAWTPSQSASIEPYAADCYPSLFRQKSTYVKTVSPERSFWEKATILHHEANRPESSSIPNRYSRHYYDLYRMSKTWTKQKALEDIFLLKKVVDFKMKFYPRGWAKYDEASSGAIRLVPPNYRIPELKSDYGAMREMLFGTIPSFEEILSELSCLESEINETVCKRS